MSVVSEIEAAIVKLQLLRGVGVMYPDNYECTYSDWENACDLIATLSRTIDAQLTILQAALGHLPAYNLRAAEEPEWLGKRPSLRNGLDLARAINGATQ